MTIEKSPRPFQKYFFSEERPLDLNGYNGLLLMLDFDGTLVPIVNDPVLCYPTLIVREYLAKIGRAGKNSVAIVSGRTLTDVRNRVAVDNIFYSGSHGLEISGPGFNYVSPEAIRMKPAIDRLRRKAERKMGHLKGVLIEKKRFSFSFHYRMMEPETRRKALQEFRSFLSEEKERDSVILMKGKKVIEVMPRAVWDKGRAVQAIMSHLHENLMPLYVGDDVTDESAFLALKKKGVTIRIAKKRDSAAVYYLGNQQEIVPFLAYLYEEIKKM